MSEYLQMMEETHRLGRWMDPGTISHMRYLVDQVQHGCITQEQAEAELPCTLSWVEARALLLASEIEFVNSTILTNDQLDYIRQKDDLVNAICVARGCPPLSRCECGAARTGIGRGQVGHSSWCPWSGRP